MYKVVYVKLSDKQKYTLYISVVLVILLAFFTREYISPISIDSTDVDGNTIKIYNE